MNSQEIIVAKADVKDLYDEVLSKSSKPQKQLAELMVTAFLLGSNCENLCVSEQTEYA
ncbi:MAG: hypothetical protein J1E85_10610 [Ruminococcus sp.]|nr:hypothetical protein [Ruminococcus sp.]